MNPNMNFDYVRAKDIQDAISLLNKYGDESRIFAGGTELLVNIKQHAISPKVLIDIKSISNLSYITRRKCTENRRTNTSMRGRKLYRNQR
jgi:CO/xanthine dehydrogenase FAD-binding subunit